MPENATQTLTQAGPSLEELSDLRTPWCVHVVATLQVAERIAEGLHAIDDIAAATSSDPSVLHGVLTHLASRGLFVETTPGRFELNELARQLLDPGSRIGLDLNGIGGRMAHAWNTLPTYVRTGEPAYKERFGLPFWADLDAHPEVAESFDALMGPVGHGPPQADFELADGWDSIHQIVDVGGGTGAMLAALLQRHPHTRGTLVELPRTVAAAEAIFRAAGVEDRVTMVGQSFFDPLPTGGDLYLLKKVLGNWGDHDAIKILRRCAEAAGPKGRVVVLDGWTAQTGPHPITIDKLLVGGKHRTVDQLGELARAAGLEIRAAIRQKSGGSHVELRRMEND